MTFSDAPVLRTEKKLLILYEGETEEGLLQFKVLTGFTASYACNWRPVKGEETIYLEDIEPITQYFKHVNDVLFLFGEFEILENYKTNIMSLDTVFLTEFFHWQYIPAKLVYFSS